VRFCRELKGYYRKKEEIEVFGISSAVLAEMDSSTSTWKMFIQEASILMSNSSG